MNSEEKLIKDLILGRELAYENLIGSMEKQLMNFIYGFTNDLHASEDIFQETFIRVLRKISEFRPEYKLSTWIFTIARNCCLDYLKSKKRKKDISLEHEEQNDAKPVTLKNLLGSKYLTPSEIMEKSEDQAKIRELLSTLSPVKKEALILRVYLDMSYEEISKITHTPIGTCKYRVYQALQELTAQLSTSKEGYAEYGA